MDMKDVSVIIPVHNAEDYLQDCLLALIGQKNSVSVEYILVNNGSTDNSKQICQEFANKYSQFKLISLDSAGVSNARNIGLKYASGTYIMFCDSDDIPSPYWVSYLYDAITKNKVDMGVCRYIRFRSVSAIKQDALPLNNAILVDDLNDQIKNVLTDPMYAGYVWNKIFKKKNIDKFNIRFDKRYSLLEDQSFVIEYLLHSDSTIYLDAKLYFYRISENGLSGAKNINSRFENDMVGRSCIFDKVNQEYSVEDSTKRIAWQQLMRTYVAAFMYFVKRREIRNTKFIILNFTKYYSKGYDLKDSGWKIREKIAFRLMCMLVSLTYNDE
ncbi:glycosyltransferase family 2 protein [Lactobacillus delbrueckii subsp. bulgaricus]|nr:hypothetical protein [Lactobacillus delbrueckii subsp. bulgaricus]MBT8864243.1 hypothetical protein [Lactobacillus delbrueckii subsp. bulgaricus]MBT8865851.1 hypothetical protein [Lactobacillus delbrueckii subsp. bulgaricus]MBT8868761.1 hypothetical protein [Lactobacillus delbrueckii subsp. bulgaricus]MBT8872208.1 hypothetical protein [Lactobacillus delbrueckii subsp. bulgaricus]